MSEVLKNIELIENYFEGKLSGAEKTAFETRLAIDSDFKEEVELYENIVAGIKETGEANLKAKLKLVDNELDAEPVIVKMESVNSLKTKHLAIAASVILIICISVYWKLSSKSNLPELAISFYEKEKGLPNEMSVSENQLSDVMTSYKNDDFVTTKNKLNELLKHNNSNDTLRYFFGITNYELKDYRTAIASFNMVSPESIYYDKAQYRLVLIELLIDDKQKALNKIDECLANRNHLYYDKLVQLRTELLK
jgi:tetratricopeptide (TPR) repeat protein